MIQSRLTADGDRLRRWPRFAVLANCRTSQTALW